MVSSAQVQPVQLYTLHSFTHSLNHLFQKYFIETLPWFSPESRLTPLEVPGYEKGHLTATVTGQGAGVLGVLHKRSPPGPADSRSTLLKKSFHSHLQPVQKGSAVNRHRAVWSGGGGGVSAWFEDHECSHERRMLLPGGEPGTSWRR